MGQIGSLRRGHIVETKRDPLAHRDYTSQGHPGIYEAHTHSQSGQSHGKSPLVFLSNSFLTAPRFTGSAPTIGSGRIVDLPLRAAYLLSVRSQCRVYPMRTRIFQELYPTSPIIMFESCQVIRRLPHRISVRSYLCSGGAPLSTRWPVTPPASHRGCPITSCAG